LIHQCHPEPVWQACFGISFVIKGMMKKYYVYILSNNSKTLYIGETIRELASPKKINLIESKNSDGMIYLINLDYKMLKRVQHD